MQLGDVKVLPGWVHGLQETHKQQSQHKDNTVAWQQVVCSPFYKRMQACVSAPYHQQNRLLGTGRRLAGHLSTHH
jgi:hypothetical protein